MGQGEKSLKKPLYASLDNEDMEGFRWWLFPHTLFLLV